MSSFLNEIRGVASGMILFSEEDLPYLLPYSWSIGSHGYAQGCGSGVKCITMHKLLLGPPPPGKLIDHVNRIKLDNRRENLRFVTPHESNMNREVTGGGIYQVRNGRYQVKLKRNRLQNYLGTYDTYAEAESVRDAWVAENDRS